jgi:hypothetical protein
MGRVIRQLIVERDPMSRFGRSAGPALSESAWRIAGGQTYRVYTRMQWRMEDELGAS